MTLSLSDSQFKFLNMNKKYRAYVGGFGCVHPYTKVHTESGLMRICDINRPMRVLSWNEKSQQFQLSLSGGAYRKGRANLYRVSTQQGEFAASGHHHVLCADGKYRPVESLRVGQTLSSSSRFLDCSSSELFQKLSPSSGQHYSQTVSGLMGDYVSECHQRDRLLRQEGDYDLSFSPSLGGAHKCDQTFLMSDLEGMELSRIHLSLLCDRLAKMGYHCRVEHHAVVEEGQRHALSFGRTSLSRLVSQQFVEKCDIHRKAQQSSSVYRSCSCSLIKSTEILSIEIDDVKSDYYDMQVLETNNYVTEDGCIHHNSGKTFSGCLDLGTFALKHPGVPQGYFAPTYPLIRDIFYMTMEEAWQLLGESVGGNFTVDIKDSNKEVHLFADGEKYGTIICRTMDKPANIVGFKIARALVDEIDVMDEKKADQAWNKIIARLRYKIDGVVNGIGVTTTPEGFKFAYKRFKKSPGVHYGMVQASTFENEMYLPDDYIDSLRDSYPAGLIDAYLLGEFVNLEGGAVYRSFCRKKNNSNEVVNDSDKMLIGMDFNVQHMAARVFVYRNGRKQLHCVDEFDELYDTDDMIEHIKMRYPGREKDITIYPDASGKKRQSVGADTSDIQKLKDAGFKIKAKDSNPRVRSRVNAVNAMFCNGKGERKLFVNVDKCPNTVEGIEQQIWNDKGEPDKTSGNDHGNDAFGYPVAFEHPIERPSGFSLNRTS